MTETHLQRLDISPTQEVLVPILLTGAKKRTFRKHLHTTDWGADMAGGGDDELELGGEFT
eukprot:COSAG02_NODE_56350_length_285_cov_0.550802_1_plen_60_part_00